MASTDQNRAYWEVQETRSLPALGEPPHKVVVKMSRAHWGCFDFLVNTVGYHPAKLVDLAEQEARHQGRAFHEVFPDAMTYMDQEFSKIYAEEE
jgi:hypothetical protein|tara:strand:+ start:391 stop:672 length:282 start_codon:yes stop_codon:yes gene_type:complete